jgi:hypothetical protein
MQAPSVCSPAESNHYSDEAQRSMFTVNVTTATQIFFHRWHKPWNISISNTIKPCLKYLWGCITYCRSCHSYKVSSFYISTHNENQNSHTGDLVNIHDVSSASLPTVCMTSYDAPSMTFRPFILWRNSPLLDNGTLKARFIAMNTLV